MRKGSIQLSMGFMVMFILAIMAFSLGLTIIYKLSSEMQQTATDLNQETKEQIQQMLVQGGKKVAIPTYKKDVQKGKDYVLGVGIKNDHENYEKFKIEVDCVGAYETDNTVICSDFSTCESVCGGWANMVDWKTKIPKRDRKMEKVFLNIPKEADYGEYVFRLKVKTNPPSYDEEYGTSKKFYLYVR